MNLPLHAPWVQFDPNQTSLPVCLLSPLALHPVSVRLPLDIMVVCEEGALVSAFIFFLFHRFPVHAPEPQVPASSVLLSAVSPWLRLLFQEAGQGTGLSLPSVSKDHLTSFLRCPFLPAPASHPVTYSTCLRSCESQGPLEDQKTWAFIMEVKQILDPALQIIGSTEINTLEKKEIKTIIKYENKNDANIDLVKVDQDLQKMCLNLELKGSKKSIPTSELVKNEGQLINSDKRFSLYKCEQCNSTFKRKGVLLYHKQVKHPDKSELTRHIEKDGDLYKCKTCSKSFPSSSLTKINLHLKLAHKVGADIQCSRCSKVFAFMYEYKIHQDVHDKVKKAVCDLCGMKLCNKRAMKDHRLYIHGSYSEQSVAKKHQCDICKKGFYLESLLAQHKQVHGEKNISCNQCDESYRTKGALKYHVKTKHFGEVHVLTEEMKVKSRIRAVRRRAMEKIKSKEKIN